MDNSQARDSQMVSINNSPIIKKFYDSTEKSQQTQPQVFPLQFDWDEYLKRCPAPIAPKEAFMQARHQLKNKFSVGMKLEARDPKRNDVSSWSLASVVALEGSARIRLRFDGSDSMSDIFELINSNNIKPLQSNKILYPPMAYKGNIARYPKFVKTVLETPGVVKAPPECFEETPERPAKNLFVEGMKLEALDRKNVHLIYPATIGQVMNDEVRIKFDGWKGSFDYTCKYYSRELFPVNWCKDNNHPILPPKGWEKLIQGTVERIQSSTPLPMRNSVKSSQTSSSQPLMDSSRSPRIVKFKSTVDSSRSQIVTSKPTVDSSKSPAFMQSLAAMGSSRTIPYPVWLEMKNKSLKVSDDQVNNSNLKEFFVSKESTESFYSDDHSGTITSPASNNSVIENSSVDSSQSSSINNNQNSNKKIKLQSTPINNKYIFDNSANSSLEPGNFPSTPFNTWSVQDVLDLIINSDQSLAKYSNVFIDNEIDGSAFVLLTTDFMINHMGLKCGPVLKINRLIERVKQKNLIH